MAKKNKTKAKKTVKKSTSKLKQQAKKVQAKQQDFLVRRPHRSFRLTPRKAYIRPFAIEGPFKFSHNVIKTIFQYKRFFAKLLAFAIIASILLVGIMSQTTYNNLRDALDQSTSIVQDPTASGELLVKNSFGGNLYKATLLFMSTATEGGFNPAKSDSQQTILTLIFIIIWLTVVWYLRNSLAGHQVGFRDALYNAGAPIVSMFAILFVIMIQLIPLGIYLIVYSAAVSTDFISGGVESMLFMGIGFLLLIMSLYWTISSFLAMIVATIPGMGPIEALRVAGDMSVGRRPKILRRVVWHLVQVLLLWALILIPLILLENYVSSQWTFIKNIPIIPFVQLALSCLTFIWTSTYIYLLYRKIIEDESKPA